MSFARRARTAALLTGLLASAACGGADAGPLFVDNPHTTWQPVIDADAVGHRTGLTVSYESAGHSYQTTLPAGLVSCPPTISERQCEREAD